MGIMAVINDYFFNLLLYGGIFLGICWIFSLAQRHRSSPPVLLGQYRSIACLLEDTPKHHLKGQSYPWATPLLTPLACLLEDTPKHHLKGQSYPWATPLLTPLACLLEDAPITSLNGQSYPWATPLACVSEIGWFSFYRQKLGKPGINYWDWKNLPLIADFSTELSDLLRLPEPQPVVKKVLESLAEEYHLFWNWENLCAFKQWHQDATQAIGLTRLTLIYQVCYGMPWDSLRLLLRDNNPAVDSALLDESSSWWKILGITAFSSPLKAEKAYKNLLRLWHPDRTLNPLSHQITARINRAYEEYQARRLQNAQRINNIQQWFKK
ncbi:MAG: J domain-containing protein [Cyanobacteria bacterium P01_G01_bin.49]